MITLTITGDTAALVLNDLAHLTNGFLAGAGQGAMAAAKAQAQRDPIMPELRGRSTEATEAAAAAVQADGAATVDDKPRRTRRTREQIAADEAAAKAAEGNGSADAGTEASSAQAGTQESASTTSGSGQTAQADASPSDAPALLDFDQDVAPVVLSLVKSRGKPWVVEVLSQFGVERASELPQDRWPELLTALEDADAA